MLKSKGPIPEDRTITENKLKRAPIRFVLSEAHAKWLQLMNRLIRGSGKRSSLLFPFSVFCVFRGFAFGVLVLAMPG